MIQLPVPALWLQSVPTERLFEHLTLAAIISVIVTIGVAWVLIRASSRSLDFMGNRVSRARFFFKRLEPIVRIAIWFIAALLVIEIAAPSRETFWAAVGSLAIALALGAQDLVKNVIGGFVVLTDRPFQLGDRVKIGEAYGEIDHIGLRSTKLTTPDDTRVTIPNAEILNGQVWNANSGVVDCQVVTDIFVPHDADPDELIELGREVAIASPFLLPTKPIVVLLADQFDQQPYMRLRIKAYVIDHRYEPALQSDITVRIKRELRKRGVVFRQPETVD